MPEPEEPVGEEPTTGEEEPEGGSEEQPPKLIGGKFKTVEDMEASYKEAERKISDQGQRLANIVAQLQNAGVEFDEQSNTISQVPARVEPQGQEDWKEQLTQRFWDDPISTASDLAGAMLTRALGTQKQARANVKRCLSSLKSEGLYRDVADDLDAELESIPDEALADPKQTPIIVGALYERVVGRFAMNQARAVKENPKTKVDLLAKLGVENPESAAEGPGVDVTREDRAVLADMGIKGEATKRVIENFRKRMQGGEE